MDLEKLDIKTSKFFVTEDLEKTFIPNLMKALNEYVTVNNEYISIKTLEEKTKVRIIV